MSKLVSNNMSVPDWQALYRMLGGLVQLGQRFKVEVPILNQITHKVSDSLYSLRSVVEQVIHFQASLASESLTWTRTWTRRGGCLMPCRTC